MKKQLVIALLCFCTTASLFGQDTDYDYGNSSEAASLCVDRQSNSLQVQLRLIMH